MSVPVPASQPSPVTIPVPAIRLRRLTLMDVLDESFRLYRANFQVLAAIAVLLVIPEILVSIGSGSYSALGSIFAVAQNPSGPTPSFAPPNLYVGLLQYPIQLALLPFNAGTLFAASVGIVLGTPVTILSALRAVLRRYWAIWVLSLLYGVAAITFACPPLGAWLLTRLAFMIPVLFTEQASIGTAVDRSWRLTDRAFWRTFAVIVLSLLLGWALQAALAGVFLTLAAVLPGLQLDLRVILIVAMASLTAQMVQPLFVLALTLLYFDRRVRREAFDLEMMTYRIAGQAGFTA